MINVIVSTQVCDSVPEAVACQIRIEAFESDVELRCSTPTLFKGELLQKLQYLWRQRNSSDRGFVLRCTYSNLHRAELQIEVFTPPIPDLADPRTAINLNQNRDELPIEKLWQ
jgi:hypothetical protein